MRDIRFRAWDSKNHQMFDVTKIDFRRDDRYGYRLGISDIPEFFTYRQEITLMQFTGLQDSKGVDIYESDIYHQGDINILYVVEWIDSGLKGRQLGNQSTAGLDHWRSKTVVIGNIYENPELLK